MAQRLFRTFVLVMLTIALLGPSPSRADDQSEQRPTISFSSTRDHPELPNPINAGEVYLMNTDGTDLRRLTDNKIGDGFANLSPDGKKIVFDSTRRRKSGERVNTSDLFLMKTNGSDQTFLTRGSNASWKPNSREVAFHASASGTGLPIRPDPGSATTDSDIFVINVGDCLEQQEITGDVEACQDPSGPIKRNLTNTPDDIEDDVDWSADGQTIVFTSHLSNDNAADSKTAEIFVMNADGTGRKQLTFSDPAHPEEERAPDLSPDGTRITYMCRPDELVPSGPPLFEICVMNADGSNQAQLTRDLDVDYGVFHASPFWLTNTKIAFDMKNSGHDVEIGKLRQLWTIDNVDDCLKDATTCESGMGRTQLTDALGVNGYANSGVVRIPGKSQDPVAASSTDRSADTVQGPAVDDGKAGHGKQAKDTKANKGKKDKNDNQHKKAKGGGQRRR